MDVSPLRTQGPNNFNQNTLCIYTSRHVSSIVSQPPLSSGEGGPSVWGALPRGPGPSFRRVFFHGTDPVNPPGRLRSTITLCNKRITVTKTITFIFVQEFGNLVNK